jgi:hypothetical protein
LACKFVVGLFAAMGGVAHGCCVMVVVGVLERDWMRPSAPFTLIV